MSDQVSRPRSLREIEVEVEAEGREWMRRRLEERLQREADGASAIFPPQPAPRAASAPAGGHPAHRRRRG